MRHGRSRVAIPRLELAVTVTAVETTLGRDDAPRRIRLVLPPGQSWPDAVTRGQAVDVRARRDVGLPLLVRGTVERRRLGVLEVRGRIL